MSEPVVVQPLLGMLDAPVAVAPEIELVAS